MYNELILTYMRSNLEDENFIQLAKDLGISINEKFIEKKIFHGCNGKFKSSDFGKGDIYIFKNDESNEMLLVNTYLYPSDQVQIMHVGIRCKSEKIAYYKEQLTHCFEETISYPIREKIREYDNDFILQMSKMEEVEESVFFDGKGRKSLIKVVCV